MKAEMLSWCRRLGLFSEGDRVICAVSGGADSMAMLWCLHCLHGAESDRDERFVREFCASRGIALTVGAAREGSYGASGVEETARRLR